MRVLLAEPPQLFLEGAEHTRQVQPLGLGYIGAALAAEHDVRLLLPDTRSYSGPDPWGEIERVLVDEAPDVVGITSVTANYPSAAKLAALVKRLNPGVRVILGGAHATTEPTAALIGAPDVDYVAQGEGEMTMLELLRELATARIRTVRHQNIPGLYWRDDQGEIHRSAARPPMTDLDALSFPLRDGLVWSDDIQPAFHQGIVTMRGCPYRSVFSEIKARLDSYNRTQMNMRLAAAQRETPISWL